MINASDMPMGKNRGFMMLAGALLLALTAWVGVKTWNGIREHKFIGVPIERNTIVVSGEGKVVAVPDVAMISLGMVVERKTVAQAQEESTRVMNAVIAKLTEFGVDKKDMQTVGYSISPIYDYNDGRSILRGYQVSQNVRVKVRVLDKAGDILAAAGTLGANQVGGIEFTNEDLEAIRQEARLKAIKNATDKAEALADAAGVKLRRVISFSESFSGGYPPPPFYADKAGVGGAEVSQRPSIEPGSNEIIVNATVTYEIE